MKLLGKMIAATALSVATLTAFAAPENYTLDASHSYVMFRISHFGYSNPSGKWYANGTLVLDQQAPQNSKVNVTIDTAAIDTGLPELDKHLKSADFFDVAKYPKATFVSDKVDLSGKENAKVTGMLTLHGVTKPVTLNVKLNKLGENPFTHKMAAGFSATAMVKRSDFGISAYLPGLGDEVKLDIEVEANKA